MVRNFISIFMLLALTSCGFSPVHSSNYSDMGIENIKVLVNNGSNRPSNLDTLLKKHLEESFNPDSLAQKNNYILEISLSKSNSSYEIQSNTVNLRTRVTLVADISLSRAVDLVKVMEDKVMSIDTFEDSDSPYAALISDEETANKMALGLAKEIKLRIVSKLKALSVVN